LSASGHWNTWRKILGDFAVIIARSFVQGGSELAQPDLSRLRIARGNAGPHSATARSWRRFVVPAAVAIGIAVAAFLIYQRTLGAAPEVEQTTVTLAYPYQAYTVLNANGYVVAQRKASVASKATGRLEWLGVVEGSRVKKGQAIARLESQDVAAARDQAAANVSVARANLAQAKAEQEEAQRQLKRTEELLAQNFVSPSVYDTAVARADKARAAVGSAQAAVVAAEANRRAAEVGVGQTVIRAPFDGVVLTKNANVGDTITPFSSALDTKGAVVTIADMSTLEVEADVSESNLQKVKVDQPCEIELDAIPDVRFQGTVSRMVPTVDRSKATVTTKISFRDLDPRILPDMSAKVAFLSEAVPPEQRAPRLAVNPAAIVERGGRSVVFLVRDNRVSALPVQTGRRIGDVVELTQGPQPGDKVVLRPPEKLKSGMAVRLAKQ
jgi:RND family efflux transporter MFP subunit